MYFELDIEVALKLKEICLVRRLKIMNPTICNMTLEERELHEIDRELLIHQIEILEEKLARK